MTSTRGREEAWILEEQETWAARRKWARWVTVEGLESGNTKQQTVLQFTSDYHFEKRYFENYLFQYFPLGISSVPRFGIH